VKASRRTGSNCPPPEFDGQFPCQEDSRVLCMGFFIWSNTDHWHSRLGYYTPESAHYGLPARICEQRAVVVAAAYAARPESVIQAAPPPPALSTIVWINSPVKEATKIR
jgi:hypothetical protein